MGNDLARVSGDFLSPYEEELIMSLSLEGKTLNHINQILIDGGSKKISRQTLTLLHGSEAYKNRLQEVRDVVMQEGLVRMDARLSKLSQHAEAIWNSMYDEKGNIIAWNPNVFAMYHKMFLETLAQISKMIDIPPAPVRENNPQPQQTLNVFDTTGLIVKDILKDMGIGTDKSPDNQSSTEPPDRHNGTSEIIEATFTDTEEGVAEPIEPEDSPLERQSGTDAL